MANQVRLDEAYMIGYDSYGSGVGEEKNPFAVTDERHFEWADGWADAQEQEEDGGEGWMDDEVTDHSNCR